MSKNKNTPNKTETQERIIILVDVRIGSGYWDEGEQGTLHFKPTHWKEVNVSFKPELHLPVDAKIIGHHLGCALGDEIAKTLGDKLEKSVTVLGLRDAKISTP